MLRNTEEGAQESIGGAAPRIIGNIFLSLPRYLQNPHDGRTVQNIPPPPAGPRGLVHRDCRLRIHRMQQQRVRRQYKRGRNIPHRKRFQHARDGRQHNTGFGSPAGPANQHHKIHPPGRHGIPLCGHPADSHRDREPPRNQGPRNGNPRQVADMGREGTRERDYGVDN